MKQVNWKAAISILFLLVMIIVQGCSSANNTTNTNSAATDKPKGEAPSTEAKDNSPIEITWWHAMGGDNGKAIDQIAADYNASQSKIIVKTEFQGSYDELITKMKATFDSAGGPTMVMVNDVNTRFMIDSKATALVQDFIDKDKFDLSKFEEHILNYYTINNKLYSMPFNTSNPLLYYNKDLFKAAGLDPEKPPATFEELTKAAKVLTKDGITGFSFYIEPWLMEQSFARQGAEYVNNDNGRTSPATESYLNHEEGVKTLAWWKSLVDDKIALNFGRTGDDAKKAFVSGQAAMYITSTGALRGVVNSVEGRFEVGTGFLPKPESSSNEGGVAIGGASNWILKNKSAEEQNAAWEFIKYLSSPKLQAYWHVSSGYFPITIDSYNEQIVKDNLVKYPQFETAIEQLHQTKSTYNTQGAVIGVFQEQRDFVKTAVEEVLSGAKTPQEALDIAAKSSTEAIAKYNQANK